MNIGIAVISPALIISVMIFMINSVNKRIDDLRSEMKSDHAKLASAWATFLPWYKELTSGWKTSIRQ